MLCFLSHHLYGHHFPFRYIHLSHKLYLWLVINKRAILKSINYCQINYTYSRSIPVFNHFLGSMFPWAQLLNKGSSKLECLLTTWFINALNFAQITLPLPLKVEVALQWRCLSQGFIHSDITSQSFSFEILDSALRISVERHKKNCVKLGFI